MNGFKVCSNGHYYQDNLDECPYCPKNQATDKTRIDSGSADAGLDKTRVFSGTADSGLNKTRIYNDQQGNEQAFNDSSNTASRKLVGWLVSYTVDANGADFKLYEGRNIIGSDPACDIVIDSDPTVSSKHLTILYRMGIYKFKDELSTNGTFINDEFSEEGNLVDGDIIKTGNTIFKFRTSL